MYNKTVWKTGDIIPADKMNNIENGIETNDLAITDIKKELVKTVKTSEKGQPNGVATLDEHGKVKELPELNFDYAGSATAVQNNLNAHTANRLNPHGVTAAQVGAYTMAQSLTSATAQLFGLAASAVPNDVLSKIKTLIDNISNVADSKAKLTVGSYIGSQTGTSEIITKIINLGFKAKFFMLYVTTYGWDLMIFYLENMPRPTVINSATFTEDAVVLEGSAAYLDHYRSSYHYVAIG